MKKILVFFFLVFCQYTLGSQVVDFPCIGRREKNKIQIAIFEVRNKALQKALFELHTDVQAAIRKGVREGLNDDAILASINKAHQLKKDKAYHQASLASMLTRQKAHQASRAKDDEDCFAQRLTSELLDLIED